MLKPTVGCAAEDPAAAGVVNAAEAPAAAGTVIAAEAPAAAGVVIAFLTIYTGFKYDALQSHLKRFKT